MSFQRPPLRENPGPSAAQATAFQRALCHRGGQEEVTRFRSMYNLFSRDAPTDQGMGAHYLHGVVGTAYSGARSTIYAVAEHQGIPVLDLTTMTPQALRSRPLREIVQAILDTPPRCAIVVALDDLSSPPCHMYKVLARMSKQQLDLRFRRVVFCLASSVDQLPDGLQSTCFPGSTEDKVQMLLYRTPAAFADAAGVAERLRPIATAMTDYAVFEPRIWRHVTTSMTLDDFLASLTFQVHRRTSIDLEKTLDSFPSFEAPWRRSFASELQKKLRPMPDVTCRGLHRVLPAGVSHTDALECIQTALPADLSDPYALTVASDAVDDRCGAIAVTQRTHHVVVNVQCTIDPGIMTEVCRELRTGCRELKQELCKNKTEMGNRFNAMADRFTSIQSELAILKELVVAGEASRGAQAQRHGEAAPQTCRKKGCVNRVDACFANGKKKKQCTSCITVANQSHKKRRMK